MLIAGILLTVSIIVLDIALAEVYILSHIAFTFVLVNFFYWFKRYKIGLMSGLIASIVIDLTMHNQLGKTLLSLVFPILIMSILDNILRIENKISSIVFAAISTIFSIFISDILFSLVYSNLSLEFILVLKKALISAIVLILICLIFGDAIKVESKKGKYL